MSDPSVEDGSLAHHLAHLAATADDVAAFLNRDHETSEIHPETLKKSEHLVASLRDVIYALTHNEHLAMTSDDVWKALTLKHKGQGDGTVS